MSETLHEHINLWSMWDYITHSDSMLNGLIGCILLVFTVNEEIFRNYFAQEFLYYVVAAFFLLLLIYYIQRNTIVKRLFSSDIETLYRRSFSRLNYTRILFLLLVIWIVTIWVESNTKYRFSLPVFLFSLALIYSPFENTLKDSLTNVGAIHIEMEKIVEYHNNYEEIQYWLESIARRISKGLRVGKIHVSRNTLVHHMNVRIAETDTTVNRLYELKESLLLEEADYSVIKAVIGIVPKSELKVYHRLQIIDKIISGRYIDIIATLVVLIVTGGPFFLSLVSK